MTADPAEGYTAAAGARLVWNQEAGYQNTIRHSSSLFTGWQTGLAGGNSVADATGLTGTLTDVTAVGVPRRFYQLIRTAP